MSFADCGRGRGGLRVFVVGVSLLGYFFYIGTAFAAVMALLISLFNGSNALERVRYNPRPLIARTVTASNEAHRRPLKKEANWQASSAFGIKEASSTNIVEQSQVLFTAKADLDKSKDERHSYPHKPKKLLARRRDDLVGGRYATVLSYAGESSFAERRYGSFTGFSGASNAPYIYH
jgi:hypothetical protein